MSGVVIHKQVAHAVASTQAHYAAAVQAFEHACPATFAIRHTCTEGEVTADAMAAQLGTTPARVRRILRGAEKVIKIFERGQ